MARAPTRRQTGRVRIGIGGWDYAPWRDTFYPKGQSKSRALEYASRQLTAIEVNGTFYRLQTPAVFAKWHDTTPADFVFSLKAPRFIVQRRELKSAETAIQRFISSGIDELQAKLGPLLWQLAPTKIFDADDLDAFLALLPQSIGQRPLRHALEVRNASFMNSEFLAIARRYKVAVVIEDDADFPTCADLTSSFVYARLRRSKAAIKTGYSLPALKLWAGRASTWAAGKQPIDLKKIDSKRSIPVRPRDVFIFFINGAKERAPAAAMKLMTQLH